MSVNNNNLGNSNNSFGSSKKNKKNSTAIGINSINAPSSSSISDEYKKEVKFSENNNLLKGKYINFNSNSNDEESNKRYINPIHQMHNQIWEQNKNQNSMESMKNIGDILAKSLNAGLISNEINNDIKNNNNKKSFVGKKEDNNDIKNNIIENSVAMKKEDKVDEKEFEIGNGIINQEHIMSKNPILSSYNDIPNKTCLINFGEAFYLNSILQCLGNIECLQNFFLNQKDYISKNVSLLPLSFVTSRLYHHFYEKDEKYSLESYLKVLAKLNIIYKTQKRRNVIDCLIFILDSLHKELNQVKNKQEYFDFNHNEREEVINKGKMNYKNLYDSIISSNFNWLELKDMHCINCGERIYDLKTYNTYQLDILGFYTNFRRKQIILFDCLDYEIRKTISFTCKKCNAKDGFRKISVIYISPKIFIFLLFNGEYDEKLLEFRFCVEEIINLRKYVESEESPVKYQLIDVISIEPNENKYVSFCKSFEDKKWYYFYDENVQETNIDQVCFENNNNKFIPCVLFYESIE